MTLNHNMYKFEEIIVTRANRFYGSMRVPKRFQGRLGALLVRAEFSTCEVFHQYYFARLRG
jgi:hypothetical protein